MFEILLQVMSRIDISYIFMIILGVVGGMFVGALPGFTATMGVALLVPFSYTLTPANSFALLIGVYCSAVYAGSIPAILINTPGTPAAVATVFDGYPLCKKGEAGKALGIACYSSVFGGILSAIILIFTSGYIAKVALKFGPQEYFALALLGMSMVAGMTGKNITKGLISVVFGMLLSLVGMDWNTGFPRFTFGSLDLMGGISLLPMMIGLFALTELLVTADTVYKHYQVKQKIIDISSSFRYWWENFYLSFRSSLMGTFLGALPGVGAVTASFVAYNDALHSSKSPEKMGKGQPEGIVAPESANNAVTGGAMIPLLSLGIPGDGVTAIMLGALLIHGLRPGPLLFKENIEVVYSIYLSMILAYFIILIIGIWGIKYLAKIVELPRYILFPFILFFSIIGSYALQNSMFDVYIALIFGILGYFMRRYDFPLGPFLLALVLGDLVEYNLIVSLQISKGNWLSFLTRPISGTILVITFLFLVFRTIKIRKENLKNVK